MFNLADLSNKPIFLLIAPFVLAFIFTAFVLPVYILWLKRLQIGQFIREEGPASHATKAKTPTTGGVIFVLAVTITFAAYVLFSHKINLAALATIILAILCAGLGLIDDLAKFMNRANNGLSAATRLSIEILYGLIFAFVLLNLQSHVKDLILWVSSTVSIGLPSAQVFSVPFWLFILLTVCMIASTTNSVNLNDGMDGLAAGVSLPIFLTLALMLLKSDNLSLAAVSMAGAGTVAAFLLFNSYPAKIFMGDVGSLFLGGLIGGLVISGGLTVWFMPLALIYICESISVIVQVSVFKLSKPYVPAQPMNALSLAIYKLTHKLPGEGKRVFRMSPLHHHFEAVFADKGIAEWQVVLGFWLTQLVICILTLAAFSRF